MSASPAGVSVDQRLCLALYQAGHAMDAVYRELLDEHGLTYPQYTVLSVLQQDGPAPVTVVARRLGLTSSTLSPLLKRLEQQGRVTRRRSCEDERTVVVDLTEQGRRVGEEVADVPQHVAAATGLAPGEQADLVGTLHRLTQALRRSDHPAPQ